MNKPNKPEICEIHNIELEYDESGYKYYCPLCEEEAMMDEYSTASWEEGQPWED